MEPGAFFPAHIGMVDALVRVGLSIVLALTIGVERFVHKKPVDFRPYVIISLASCALAIAVLELGFANSDSSFSIDPAKVISGVMTGIGFLGAGALFREGDIVKGAGSASSIWAAGAVGLICGLGLLWLAGLLALGVVILFLASRSLVDTDVYTLGGNHGSGKDPAGKRINDDSGGAGPPR